MHTLAEQTILRLCIQALHMEYYEYEHDKGNLQDCSVITYYVHRFQTLYIAQYNDHLHTEYHIIQWLVIILSNRIYYKESK